MSSVAVVAISLRSRSVSVEPGTEATTVLIVENLSPVVQRIAVAVEGRAAAWTVADPAALSLLPGQVREVIVRFGPPRAPDVTAGTERVGLLVTPRAGDGDGKSAATEVEVVVSPFVALDAVLDPLVSRGVRRAHHALRVRNDGNVPVDVELSARDPDGFLELDVRPASLLIGAGSEQRARVRVRVVPGWPVGDDPARPFTAMVRAGDAPPITLGATMLLRRVRPAPVAASAVAVVALTAIGLLALLGRGEGPKGPAPAGIRVSTTVQAGTTATPARPTATPLTTSAPTTTASAPPAGPAAAIALGATCRASADLRINGRSLTHTDGRFVRTFADEAAAVEARKLLSRKPMFCSTGKTATDDAELTFFPPPIEPTPSGLGGTCSAKYAPDALRKDTQDAKFLIQVAPGQVLLYTNEADRDRAYALLQGYGQICAIGGGADSVLGRFFEWDSAVTYF